ncbi:hypothetical protein HUJ05_009067 [Dendroctonus ponderosae]|nr:hypothetical protein HUJ05_009063 [Dendroctonus ponderosae]KAH1008517.1 hypothetical protein HUJ05_009067 [Dendroctonus ponderosae]
MPVKAKDKLVHTVVDVDQAAHHADIQPNEVQPGEDVVAANHHAQIGDTDVLQAANDGGGRVVVGSFQISSVKGQKRSGNDHEQGIVEHQSVFAQFFGIQLLLRVHSIDGGEEVVKQHKDVALQVEGQIIAGCQHSASNHHVDAELYTKDGPDPQNVQLQNHGH